MSVHPLCVGSDPVLRVAARPIEAFTAEFRRLAGDLIETMYANDGVGLAAPQIGRSLQMFVINLSRERGRELVVVNPVLEAVEGRVAIVEGCLSLPKVWERVRRGSRVRLRGRDISGTPLTVQADGLLAVALQHECDHLQGRLFIDRLSWLRQNLCRRRAAPCA